MKFGSLATAATFGISAAASIPFNGWYHCEMNSINYNMYMRSAPSRAFRHVPMMNVPLLPESHISGRALNSYSNYECGEFQLPMCHEEVCHHDRGKTVDIFVKRKRANPSKVQLGKEKVLWVLQGGPGDASTAMEQLMSSLYWEMNETVSIYTMDHRGTGRSGRLKCDAAEAMTSGSKGGLGITREEYPNCFKDLLFQVNNHTEAFSVTSAAYDLKKVIEDTQTSNQVFVYALSYGTYLVERLMQLESQSIHGYVVDSIVSQSAPNFATMATFTNWDKDVARVGERFLDTCSNDTFCSAKFDHANVRQLTWDLYKQLDEDAKVPGTNTCADLVNGLGIGDPSESLRSLFGSMLQSQTYREMIPAMIFRLHRCADKDVNVLQTFVDKYIREDGRWSLKGSREADTLYYSELLYGLIVYSEMWERPTPSFDDLYTVFLKGIMGGETYALVESYCTFTGARDPACAEFHLPSSPPFIYKPDRFWNKTAAVPAHATALLMSGGLDPQTERTYARAQYAAMTGKRRLIEFPLAGHCTTFTTRRVRNGNTCGVMILASYVVQGGDVNAIDTSCMVEIAPLTFDGAGKGWLQYFGTMDAFDGDTHHYAYVQKAATREATRAFHTEVALGVGVAAVIALIATVVAVLQTIKARHLSQKNQSEVKMTAAVDVSKNDLTSSTDVAEPVENEVIADNETPGTPPESVVV
ncbi:hypothetical protein AeMF1_013050 [Aphanomyces euteiches]|nr:hypothetical protein AeMF1_013050 [Aphanomyces euteiches]KAH9195643.1 hypothetical protein AeNC1_002393 [Aphanomyces euteiches]